MSNKRKWPNIPDDAIDLVQSTANPRTKKRKLSDPLVRKVADEGGFSGRLPSPGTHKPRIYRSGRSVTFATKTKPETLDNFYRVADEQGWKVAETFERAVELLVKIDGQ